MDLRLRNLPPRHSHALRLPHHSRHLARLLHHCPLHPLHDLRPRLRCLLLLRRNPHLHGNLGLLLRARNKRYLIHPTKPNSPTNTSSLKTGITLEEMDALFANSCCKAVWAGIRGRPIPGLIDPAERGFDGEKGKMDVQVQHVERQNQNQDRKAEM
jgi:hypothetical protein